MMQGTKERNRIFTRNKTYNYKLYRWNKNGVLIHNIELDFIINVNKDDLTIVLSPKHTEYKWLDKNLELLDE